jgi:hypothetical protein
MECLKKEVGEVVISVIENIITDAVGDDKKSEKFNEIVARQSKLILQLSLKLQNGCHKLNLHLSNRFFAPSMTGV